jgi:hypothetical protein
VNGDRLDAQQRELLWRIYQGETMFRPPSSGADGDCRDFDFLVQTLVSLKQRGYVDSDGFKTPKDPRRNGCHYLFAEAKKLTYRGYQSARSLDPAPAAAPLAGLLTAAGLHQCQRDFERALGSIATDPEQAIGNASSLLESICKAILERAGEPAEEWRIKPLVEQSLKHVALAPASAAEPAIASAIAQLADLAQSIGTIRNKSAAAHGRGPDHRPLQPRHARLAVNAAATVGLFLLETASEQTERQP